MYTRSRRFVQNRARGQQSRPGFALFMALGALVIIGVLVAGSSFIAVQETRLGQNSIVQTRAFSVAEYGLNKIQADWDKTPNLQMPNGQSFDTSYASLDGRDTSEVRYTRLNNETFWIVSTGRSKVGNTLMGGSRTAVKRVGAVLRLRIPTIEAKGAITAGGNVSVKGNAGVNGRDSVPPDWGCTNTPQDLPGVVVPPGSTVSTQGSATVKGTPPTATDAQAGNAETYFGFGEENWASLIAQANVNLGPLTSPAETPHPMLDAGGYCDKTNNSNWGEPIRPSNFEANMGVLVPACYNYFPIIYAPNGLSLNGHGRGQGILLVQGNLEINGSFDWYGVVVVTNDIIRGNGSARVMGAVMARNETVADASVIAGTTSYNYSACGVERALRGSAQVVQAKERAWTELY
jgi:hypothetical protein